MPALTIDKEVKMLRQIASVFPRHPLQVNNLLESDAEIMQLKKNDFKYLVLKTDGLDEEISNKLYTDPYLIGWMSITATISDLAAVGSQPLGLLLNLQIPKDCNSIWMKKYQQGVNAACAAYAVSILGGDTHFSDNVSISTTGIATIGEGKPMMRTMFPGESLYSTGKLGLGNAFAYSVYLDNSMPVHYQPVARLKESKIIRDYASGCMDTSDGLFPALSVLSEINSVGFQIIPFLEDIIHEDAIRILETTNIPHWIFLAGPHGEYELLFTIPPDRQTEFENACTCEDWSPVYLGKIIPGNRVYFDSEVFHIHCEPSIIANLFQEAGGDIKTYFELLMKQHTLFTKQ